MKPLYEAVFERGGKDSWSLCFGHVLYTIRRVPATVGLQKPKKDKELAEKEIIEMNKTLEPIIKEQWELTTYMARIGLRNKPGVRPIWKWNQATGKLIRHQGEGID
jgi:hypothetical protein